MLAGRAPFVRPGAFPATFIVAAVQIFVAYATKICTAVGREKRDTAFTSRGAALTGRKLHPPLRGKPKRRRASLCRRTPQDLREPCSPACINRFMD